MDQTARRRLTDAVTVSRVPIAVVMVLARRRRRVVAASFLLGVLTDVIDGPLARRLGTVSPRGARLDSVADAAFVAASSIASATTIDRSARPLTGAAASVVTATRLTTLLVTRRRHGIWSIMHTDLNKATGAGLAVVAAVALVRGRMPIVALGAVAALGELAALEELAIVASASEYDVDRRRIRAQAPGVASGAVVGVTVV